MNARTIPATSFFRRVLLYLAAVLFGATVLLFSLVWIRYIELAGTDKTGMEFTYSLASRSLTITRVLPGWNAYQVGLRPGDQILAINNMKLNRLTPYYQVVGRGKSGDVIHLSVVRSNENSPRSVALVLEAPRPVEMFRAPTPGMLVASRLMECYPFFFLVVGLAVLFLKIEDRNAWLLALVFAGFIALPDIPPGGIRPVFRGFFMAYHIGLAALLPAVLYYFLAVFPAKSPLERRVPWVKWVLFVGAGAALARDFWTLAVANAFQTIWLPLEYGGPAWIKASTDALNYVYVLAGEGLAVASLIGNTFGALMPDARRKARVIVWGVVCGLSPLLLLLTALYFTGRRFQDTPFWLYAFCVLALFLLPLSFAYAVVKHRVLEIPVLLRRSARYLLVQRGFVLLILLVTWGASTAFVLASAHLLKSSSEVALPLGLGAGVALGGVLTWGATEAAKRGTRKIDRAFFRNAYDARQVLEDLAQKTRKATGRKKLAALLETEITQALHPMCLAVYLENGDGRLNLQRETVHSPELQPGVALDAPLLQEAERRGEPFEIRFDQGHYGPDRSVFDPIQPDCVVPILGGDAHLSGVVVLGARLSEEPYSREDRRLLASVASQAGMALESIRLGEKIAERIEAERRIAQEMEYAKQVQARLFPQKLPSMKTLEYAGGCIQARQVGGDYYDFLELRPGRLALVLADIAGKGISGALLMANLQANLRSQYAVALDDLPRLLKSVNQLFYENSSDSSYATLFFADYDDSSRRLRYVNCGHLPPLLLRADGQLERLTATNTVLGLFEKWECAVAEVQLAPGDTLVLYTDGVTEAENAEGEQFGESRLAETMLAQAPPAGPLSARNHRGHRPKVQRTANRRMTSPWSSHGARAKNPGLYAVPGTAPPDRAIVSTWLAGHAIAA